MEPGHYLFDFFAHSDVMQDDSMLIQRKLVANDSVACTKYMPNLIKTDASCFFDALSSKKIPEIHSRDDLTILFNLIKISLIFSPQKNYFTRKMAQRDF